MNNIISFIKKSRLKLNTIIIFSWFLKIIFISGIISGFIIFILRFFKLYNMNIFNWAIFTLTGGLIGIIIGWSKRIDILSASKWLDDYLKNNDMLSSALICVKRKCDGIFDKLIIEKADKSLEKYSKINWPLKDIFKRLLIATITCLFCIYILEFWNPVYNRKQLLNLNSNTKIDNNSNNDKEFQDDKNWVFNQEQNSKDLSRLLFPENREFSELAEKALEKGDTEMLDELFQKEISKLDEMIKNAKTQTEKEEIKQKQEEQLEAMRKIKSDGNRSRENEDQNNKGSSKEPNNENQEGKNQSENNNQQIDQNEDDSNEAGFNTTEEGDGTLSGAKQSDKGESNQKVRRDNFEDGNTNEKLLLTQKKDSLDFEFLLPEKESRVPLKDVIINSRRSAESAVIRKGVPVEYEDFVRSYFMSLLQEMKKNLPEEEEEK